jgi:hypothetical protein
MRLAGSVLTKQYAKCVTDDRYHFAAVSIGDLQAMNVNPVAVEAAAGVGIIPERSAAQAEITNPRG